MRTTYVHHHSARVRAKGSARYATRYRRPQQTLLNLFRKISDFFLFSIFQLGSNN